MTSTESQPLLTVIVAVYNGAKTLQQCIDSVATQSYKNKELIIIDGGSRDGTVDLLKSNDSSIGYWISEPDSGIYNAWNKGVSQAKGEWVCFLGADDYFLETDVLEKVSVTLSAAPAAIDIAYSRIMLLTADDVRLYPIGDPWPEMKKRFRHLMCIPHQGVMHRRSLFDRKGMFDESFRIAGDYELLLRLLKEADALFIPDVIMTGMRQGGVSSDPSQTLVAMQELRRAQRTHGQVLPGWPWLTAMGRVYLRFLLWRLLGEQLTKKALDIYRRMRRLPAYWTKI
jgi:glycosyltransferase involved in cell wall biosynthesis